jgi:hypothetical protein
MEDLGPVIPPVPMPDIYRPAIPAVPRPEQHRPERPRPALTNGGLPINYVPQEATQTIKTFPNRAMARIKPLKPNTLDKEEDAAVQERAKQREKSGVKWVKTLDRV